MDEALSQVENCLFSSSKGMLYSLWPGADIYSYVQAVDQHFYQNLSGLASMESTLLVKSLLFCSQTQKQQYDKTKDIYQTVHFANAKGDATFTNDVIK